MRLTISTLPGFEDRHQIDWQGASLDLRYKLFDRNAAPFGLTFALETHADLFDDITAAPARRYGTELTLALDRELIPNRIVAAFNLLYEPESTHLYGMGVAEQQSTAGIATAVMAQIRPGFLIGGELRYLRQYEGIGLDDFAGQALYAGPTAYWQLSENSGSPSPGAPRFGVGQPDPAQRWIWSISSATRLGDIRD